MKFAPSRRADQDTFYRIFPVTGFGSPIGPPHLSPPRCRQHQELKGQSGGGHPCRCPHRLRDWVSRVEIDTGLTRVDGMDVKGGGKPDQEAEQPA